MECDFKKSGERKIEDKDTARGYEILVVVKCGKCG